MTLKAMPSRKKCFRFLMAPRHMRRGLFLFPWSISRGTEHVPGVEALVPVGGSPCAVGTAGNGGLPSRGPISWEEMGERTPEGRGSSLWTPFSGGVVWGKAVLLVGYPACGPLFVTLVTARPPAGRAGDVDRYPLGKGGEKPFRFPLFPPVNEPLRPPAQPVGGP